MDTLTLNVTDLKIEYSYQENNQTQHRIYRLNRGKTLGENLEYFKTKIPQRKFDAIIIDNPLDIDFSDTIVSCMNRPIDMGLTMENLLHIPTVGVREVAQKGLQQAIALENEYAGWHLDYFGMYNGKRQYGQESMQTLGNGFFGLRGTYVEAKANEDYYPGTYVAGVFNQLTTRINGKDVINEDLVNLPNGQFMTFSIDGGDKFNLNEMEVENVYRSLDMQTGTLTIQMYLSLKNGKKLKLTTTKVADMMEWHNYALKYEIQPLNFNGEITVFTQIDGSVINSNVERYRDFDSKHLKVINTTTNNNVAFLEAKTVTSDVGLIVGSKIESPDISDFRVNNNKSSEQVTQAVTFEAVLGRSYTIEKTVTIYTSLETPGDIAADAFSDLRQENFGRALNNSRMTWNKVWDQADIEIGGDVTAQKLIRLNVFHATVSARQLANEHLDVSVGARGLHGEAYRGHIFWDEQFIMPFYVEHFPELAKNLLHYRYKRLDQARDYAASENYEGAMYPWQSGMYGDEQAQFTHLNPITNDWDADNSRLQRHVSLSVAYNILNYFNNTQDEEFMRQYGLEMILSIAKFWLSKIELNNGKANINGVMGPDEFHEGYPNSDKPGLNNNAYTNLMTAWLFKKVNQFRTAFNKDELNALYEKVGLTEDDLDKMEADRHNLELEFNEDGIIGQFDGYFDLKDIDFDAYHKQYGDISRMDRILKAEGESPDAYKVAKQADSLMAMYNLPYEEIESIMEDLGYPVANDFLKKNVEYYLKRTTHGSTLSRIVFAKLAFADELDDEAWKLFYEALTSDYYDIQGGTTAEGIHLGVMGATMKVVTGVFAGVDINGSMVKIEPHMPKQWNFIHFKFNFHNIEFEVTVSHDDIIIKANHDTEIEVYNSIFKLTANHTETINYQEEYKKLEAKDK